MDPEVLKKRYEPKKLGTIEPDRQISAARFSPCGKFLLAACFDGTVRRWEVSAGEPIELAPFTGHNGWVQDVAFGRGDARAYSCDSWGNLRSWIYAEEEDAPAWQVEAAHDGWIYAVAVSPDGKLLATSGSDKTVRLWSTGDGKPLGELAAHRWPVMSVAFHPSGDWLVSGDMSGRAIKWHVAERRLASEMDAGALYALHRLQDVGGVRCLAFDQDGKTLACGGTAPKNGGNVQGAPTIVLFDFETGKTQDTIELGPTSEVYVFDMHLHPDGFIIAVQSGGPGNGKLLFHRPGDKQPFFASTKMPNCHSLSIHPDGLQFAVAATNGGSNGNGRRVDKNGNYLGNHSPIHLWTLPDPIPGPPEPPAEA